jgi:MFS family permease
MTETGSPHRPKSTLRTNFRRCTYDGLAATPMVFLATPGNMLVAYLLTDLFPMGDTFFGTIVSLTSWFNVVQVFLAGWIRSRFNAKSASLMFCWLQTATWLVLMLALPHVPPENSLAAQRLFFILFAMSALSGSIAGVMWNSWVKEWSPERVRGKYFGFRNSLLQIANIGFLLLVGEILARFEGEGRVLGFQIVLGVAILLRVFSVLIQYGIHSPPVKDQGEPTARWQDQLRVMLQAKPFLWTVAFSVMWAGTTSVFGPFFMRFMIDGLHMPPSEVTRVIIVSSVTGALSLPAWGQLIDRYGCRSVLIACVACWMIPGIGWTFLTPDRHGILIWMFASGGIFGAGFVLGHFMLLLKVVPVEAKTLAVSVNVAVASLVGAVGPILGGLFMEHLKGRGFSPLAVYQGMSLGHHLLAMTCILALRRINEPKAASFTQLFGAMRSVRAVAGLLGATFLQNYVFVRRRK